MKLSRSPGHAWRCLPLALSLAAAACGSEADGGGVQPPRAEAALQMLARRPDVRFHLPGDLVPRKDVEWGASRGPGWDRWSEEWTLPDGRRYLQTNQPTATLLLPAPRPAARTLALVAWCPAPLGDEPPAVEVLLNGFSLGTHPLATTPGTLEIHTEEQLWLWGENRLELRMPRAPEGAPPPQGAPPWETLALARVHYGDTRPVDATPAAGTLSLAPDTGARYLLEAPRGGTLELAGATAGRGELEIDIARLDAETGSLAEPHVRQSWGARGALRIALRVPAPDPGHAVLALELRWSSSTGDPLALTRCALHEEDARARPPIVFVSIDTLSARHLSLYGYGRRTSPVLEQLAEEAVVFERCVANAPWTLPSYLSVMTGLYPGAHFAAVEGGANVRLDNYDYWQVADNRWTLAETLRARGYQTAASVDTQWLSPRFRIDQGFDLYDTEPAYHPFWDPTKGIRLILSRFGPWLDEQRHPDAPFFVFIHALDAHGPYWPEPPFRDAFAADLPVDLAPTPAGSAPQTYGAIPTWMAWTLAPADHLRKVEAWSIPREQPLARIVQMYDETILKVDASLGELFELLRARGLYDESLIVITGDHGESFAHEFYSHGCMWEDILHVPLILKLPHGELGGTRVAESVQLVDLYPTLFELAGAGTPRAYLHGRSLVPLMRGEGAGEAPVTFSEGGHVDQYMLEQDGLKLVEMFPGKNAGHAALLTHPLLDPAWIEELFPTLAEEGMLTEALKERLEAQPDFGERFRALQERLPGPYYELYDLRADPQELRNLADERPDDVQRLRSLLDAERAKAQRARKHARAFVAPAPLSQDQLDALQDLGYL